MNVERRELMELECQVRLIKMAARQDPEAAAIDLFIDGFWEGTKAAFRPRSRERLEGLLAEYRAKLLK